MNRRQIIQVTAALPLTLSLSRLRAQTASYPVVPSIDETTGLPLLRLHPKYKYRSFGWTGDLMSNAIPTPDRHDGMAVVKGSKSEELVLLRNHERSFGDVIQSKSGKAYDSATDESQQGCGGGVTAVVIRDGEYVETVPVLAGTMINCAGGPTPWGTWLTCEEIVYRGSLIESSETRAPQDHGYVFECLPPHMGDSSHTPIVDMGLMKHEAAAVDPSTGYVYQTEDNGNTSGFYRFVPNDDSQTPGSLESAGALYMMKVSNQDNANLIEAEFGDEFDVEWVKIKDPNASPAELVAYGPLPEVFGSGMSGPYMQGHEQGGARFARGEGCWHHNGVIYFIDTSGGRARAGSIWAYEPKREKLVAYFVSQSESMADAIDNLCVHPKDGSIIACEDGGGMQDALGVQQVGTRLLRVLENNSCEIIAENNMVLAEGVPEHPVIAAGDYRSSEFAGATYSPDGKTLYVNIQTPGVTFAIEERS